MGHDFPCTYESLVIGEARILRTWLWKTIFSKQIYNLIEPLHWTYPRRIILRFFYMTSRRNLIGRMILPGTPSYHLYLHYAWVITNLTVIFSNTVNRKVRKWSFSAKLILSSQYNPTQKCNPEDLVWNVYFADVDVPGKASIYDPIRKLKV